MRCHNNKLMSKLLCSQVSSVSLGCRLLYSALTVVKIKQCLWYSADPLPIIKISAEKLASVSFNMNARFYNCWAKCQWNLGWNKGTMHSRRSFGYDSGHKDQPRTNGTSFLTYCVTCLVGNDSGHKAQPRANGTSAWLTVWPAYWAMKWVTRIRQEPVGYYHWDRYYRVTADRENWNWGEWRW